MNSEKMRSMKLLAAVMSSEKMRSITIKGNKGNAEEEITRQR